MPQLSYREVDNDDIVTVLEEEKPKPLTKAQTDQLAAARVKALDSRRRTQKAGLEARLHEVRFLLGELEPKHMERVLEALMTQERDLRRQQSELTAQLIELPDPERGETEATLMWLLLDPRPERSGGKWNGDSHRAWRYHPAELAKRSGREEAPQTPQTRHQKQA